MSRLRRFGMWCAYPLPCAYAHGYKGFGAPRLFTLGSLQGGKMSEFYGQPTSATGTNSLGNYAYFSSSGYVGNYTIFLKDNVIRTFLSIFYLRRKIIFFYAFLRKIIYLFSAKVVFLQKILNCMKNALLSSEQATKYILRKATFWARHEHTPINERQRLMLNNILDGDFIGKLQSSKWAKICKCSQDTAIRDIKDLLDKDILRQEEEGGGRNTNYELAKL
jgi:hypothetical protein